MVRHLFLFLFLFISIVSVDKNLIYGKWDLVENETIASIRASQGFQLADFETQSLADRLFTLSLDSVYYTFVVDTLFYDDLDPDLIRTIDRKAIWTLFKDTLLVKEAERIYFRRYLVKKLTSDSLWISPIFDDNYVSKHSLKFVKVKEELD